MLHMLHMLHILHILHMLNILHILHMLHMLNNPVYSQRNILPEKDRILTKLEIKIDNVSKFIPILVQLSSESVKV